MKASILSCTQCSAPFEVTQEDRNLYEKVSPKFSGKIYTIPDPTFCPDCRQQRRLTFRNERNLYTRKCDLSGKNIISLYKDTAAFPVYDQSEWWSDKWDATDYAEEFDFSQSFFQQFQALSQKVPRMAMAGSHCENSDYAPFSIYTKNGYLAISCCYSEDVYYSYQANRSKNCVDCSLCDKCELCYESINCENCFEVCFSSFSKNCSNSWFLHNCVGCSDCFGCVNLRNKQYHLFNTKYSKEEYEKKIKDLGLLNTKNIQNTPKKFKQFIAQNVQRSYYGENNESSTGNDIFNCKNSDTCFESKNLEDCKFCGPMPNPGGKDCYDAMYSPDSELLYEVLSGVNGYKVAFVVFSWDMKDSFYIQDSFYSQNCFGCVGLKKKQYCILNKQYTKEEYEVLVPKIIEHMQKTREWGEFFPSEISPFAYTETVAQEYFPMKKEEKSSQEYMGAKGEISENIHDVDASICQKILQCEVTGKRYKITPQELKFYKQMNLPIPRKCPEQRHKERMSLRNPRKLFSRKCDNCSEKIKTTFSPDRPEKVFCEKCYLENVY